MFYSRKADHTDLYPSHSGIIIQAHLSQGKYRDVYLSLDTTQIARAVARLRLSLTHTRSLSYGTVIFENATVCEDIFSIHS